MLSKNLKKFVANSLVSCFLSMAIIGSSFQLVLANSLLFQTANSGLLIAGGVNPFGNGSGMSYGANPYYSNYNPYVYSAPGTVYGGYGNPAYVQPGYGNPAYVNPGYYGRYNAGGASTPIYGVPQVISGNTYGINTGGRWAQFWRAPSGFYYPWSAGYGYTSYPIYVMPPNGTAPSQTLPPVSTVVSDLDNYLDKAKQNGKISAGDYQSLRLRANDLLAKEKSLAYEEGGVIDADDEAGIRRDIEGLSAEVAHRVRP